MEVCGVDAAEDRKKPKANENAASNGDNACAAGAAAADGNEGRCPIARAHTMYAQMSAASQFKCLKTLLDISSLQVLSQVHAAITPRLRLDFIGDLPTDLARNILRFCDARSLCNAAQVNRQWNKMAEDDVLWHRLCAQHINRKCASCGWGLPVLGPCRSKRTKLTWKTVYADRMLVEKSWRNGSYELTDMKGHKGAVLCLQFDSEKIVSGGADETMRVFCIRTGKCTKVFADHEDAVNCLQFDDKKVVSGTADGTVWIWNLDTGDMVRKLVGHTGSVTSLQFDEARLVSGSVDRTIRLWEFATGESHELCGHEDAVNSVRMHDNHVVSASDDGSVMLWDAETRQCVRVFKGHLSEVQSLGISHDVIVSGSLDNTIKFWNLNTGACFNTLFGHTDSISALWFNQLRLLSASQDETIKVWDRDSGQLVHTLRGHDSPVLCLAASDSRVVSGAEDGRICVWDFGSGSTQ